MVTPRPYWAYRRVTVTPRVAMLALLAVTSLFRSGMAGASDRAAADPASVESVASPAPGPSVDLLSLSLEQLGQIEVPTVEGASRHSQSVSSAPSFVSVITAEEIRGLGKRDLASILEGATGVYTRYDRNFSYLGVRGFGRPGDYNTHVLVLVDGHRVNDNVGHRVLTGSGFLLDVDAIDRVEIIRGPGSSLYGSNAILGVVNIITRSGAEAEGGRVSGVVAGLGTRGIGYQFGTAWKDGTDLLLTGSHLGSDGQRRLYFPEFDDAATNGGLAVDADADTWTNVAGKLRRGSWQLSGAYAHRRKTIPTATFGTYFNDARTQTADRRGYLTLEQRSETGSGVKFRNALSFDAASTRGDYVYDYAEVGAPPDLVLNVDRFRDRSITGEVQAQVPIHPRHLMTAGIEIVDVLASNQSNSDEAPAATYLDDRRSGWNYAAYLQDELAWHADVTLNAGVRFDRSYLSGTALSPRLGLVYSPDPGRAAKLLYGSAFRAPSPNELFYQDGGLSQVPNPELRPERIQTLEVVLENSFGRHVRGTASAFHFQIRNLISETNTEPGIIQLINQGRVQATGAELEVEGRWSDGLRTRCGYSYTMTRDDISGERLVNAPVHLVRIGVIAPLGRWPGSLGVEARASSSVQTLAGSRIDGHVVVDVTLAGRAVFGRFAPVLSVLNAADTRYRVPGGPENVQDTLEQDGRLVQFRLRASF